MNSQLKLIFIEPTTLIIPISHMYQLLINALFPLYLYIYIRKLYAVIYIYTILHYTTLYIYYTTMYVYIYIFYRGE